MGFYLSGSQWSFGHIWIYLDVFGICKQMGAKCDEKRDRYVTSFDCGTSFYFEWGTDNACYLHDHAFAGSHFFHAQPVDLVGRKPAVFLEVNVDYCPS